MTSFQKSTCALCILFLLAIAATAVAAPEPRSSYAIHLEATPSEAFPFLDKLGTVEIAVYPEGVRADSPWLSGFVRSGSDSVRVENQALRLYSDATFDGVRRLFSTLRPEEEEKKGIRNVEIRDTKRKGTIGEFPVSCYRLQLAKNAWIDVWSTTAVKDSEAYERLQSELLTVVSPELAEAARRIPGTILKVIVNTEDIPEKTLLRTRKIYLSSAGHQEALQTGRFFLRAPSLDRLVK